MRFITPYIASQLIPNAIIGLYTQCICGNPLIDLLNNLSICGQVDIYMLLYIDPNTSKELPMHSCVIIVYGAHAIGMLCYVKLYVDVLFKTHSSNKTTTTYTRCNESSTCIPGV